ncbi:MAG: L-threonylcarbamoyladenylate synthase [Thiotrichales bacterium]
MRRNGRAPDVTPGHVSRTPRVAERIAACAAVLRSGGIIAYPTETVYGLGCLARDRGAVRRIIAIKQRDLGKGLILIGAELAQLLPYTATLSPTEIEILRSPRARPTTWVVPTAPGLDPMLTGGRSTIAIRLTSHPIAGELCRLSQSALVSTSANLSGEAPARHPDELPPRLARAVDLIVAGACAADAVPSQIIDLLSGAVLRA